jgi:hypothetical protein
MRFWLAFAISLAAAAPSSAAVWSKREWLGFEAAHGHQGLSIANVAWYYSRYGLGAGSALFDAKAGGWDVPRTGRPDASGHFLYQFAPLRVYWTLWSRDGWLPDAMLDLFQERSVAHVDLYASYTPFGRMTGFTQAGTNVLGDPERQAVAGSVPASILEYGLRADAGTVASVSVGRLRFRTSAADGFREKSFDRWFASVSVYAGGTFGETSGGGAGTLLKDVWYWLKTPFVCRGPVCKE